MKKQLFIFFMVMTILFTSLPITAWASVQTVDPTEHQSFEVMASATVTEDDLVALGLNVVVSFPVEIALSIDEDKAFSGSEKVYAYGIMDSNNTLSVTIDTTNENYGKVKYRESASDTGMDSGVNFFATVTESLDKESFTAEETKDNYLAQMKGIDMVSYSQIDVCIQNLIPTSGTGIYYTNVPFRIELQ